MTTNSGSKFELELADEDSDRIAFNPSWEASDASLSVQEMGQPEGFVFINRDEARKLAAALLAWADNTN